MLSITSHRANAKPNHSAVLHCSLLEWISPKRQEVVLAKCGEKNPCTLLVEIDAVAMKNSMEASKILKIVLPSDPFTLNMYLKEIETLTQKYICIHCVHCSIILISKTQKDLNVHQLINGNVMFIYSGILFTHKKEGNSTTNSNNNKEKP